MAEETNDGGEVIETQETGNTQSPASVSQEFDRKALEDKVSERLASINSDDDGTEPEKKETPAEEVAETVEQESPGESGDEEAGEQEAAATEKKDDATAEKPAPVVAKKPGAPTLPDAYRRSLKAYDWSDEEIDAGLASGGLNFVTTASKIHANRNTELAAWAAAGRQAREQQNPQQQEQPRGADGKFAAQQQGNGGLQVIKPVDVAALKKQYGEDGIVDAIAGPVNAAIEQINKLVPALQQSTEQAQRAELDTLGRQIESFFTGLKGYEELYGDASKEVKPENVQSRNKVLELADALIAGARIQGRKMSLEQAMIAAHDSTSGDFKAKAARKEVVATLQQRAKGVTLKPGGKKAAPAAKPGDRSSLEKKVKSGLASVFG